ncbi:uncharacterized protein GIQ15_03063 [Arthroderma uncinatum]|uniref:uncharacterized protein n=1 Tax=Arthroderma uncinatum TaxID=74035 RepID=UPI00144AC3F5|nr:uncharacterized protein GIQ15_03063 [Arthroderma uncinatum]KAF3483739.1 hypothetical protein GIQ15_03063 [Arthroderma uncinatum]
MVLLRLTVKVAPRTLEGEEKGDDLPKCTSFLMVIHRPEMMSLGELGWKVTEQWKKLRPEAEPLKIKKLLDDNHDSDELDADLSVADVFIDNGKAYADGLDQRGVLRVLQVPTSTRSTRYGSVVQDWDTITDHYSRTAARASKRRFPPFSAANGLDQASPAKSHAPGVNGDPFEVAESIHPLCSIEEEPSNTDTNRRIEPSPALGEWEPTQDTADTTVSKPRSSPLDALPGSARISRYNLSKQSQKDDNALDGTLAAEIRTSLNSREYLFMTYTSAISFTDLYGLTEQAAILNPVETKTSTSAVESRPSGHLTRSGEHYAKRPRATDSDEPSDQPAASTTKQTRSKRAKRQKVAETSVPEPEDDKMADVQPTDTNIEKQVQADRHVEKENASENKAVKGNARMSIIDMVRPSSTAMPAVIDLTGTQSTAGETNSKPKSNQIGLGITASPPKKRTVDKLDIRKDNTDTSLTPKTPRRLNRPRIAAIHRQSMDSPMSRASTEGFRDIPFAPPSAKLDRKIKPNRKSDSKKAAKPPRGTEREAGRKSINENQGETWADQFDALQPGCDFDRMIPELENTIYAAKRADATQHQIPKMEKLLSEIVLLQDSYNKGGPSQERSAIRKRARRAKDSLATLEEPTLDWETPIDGDEDEDSDMVYGPPESSSADEESGDEVDGEIEAKAPYLPSESNHEAVDDEPTIELEDEKESEDENEEEEEEEEDDEREEVEVEEEEATDEDDDVEMRERASPSLSDVTSETSARRPRGSSKKLTRAKSSSVYSVSLSGSEAPELEPEPEPENAGSDSESDGESVSEDEQATPRATAGLRDASRQSSSTPSRSNKSESVEKPGEKSELQAAPASEGITDVRPAGTQEEESSTSSEGDGGEDNDKIAKVDSISQESESSSSEESNSEEESNNVAKVVKPLERPPLKNGQVTVFEDNSDSDSSVTSEGSDIPSKKIESDNDSPLRASISSQPKRSGVAPPKKAHILKRSQTPLHKPIRTSIGSGPASRKKNNPASSPLAEDKFGKSEFTTFSQPAPMSMWASPRISNGSNAQPTPNRMDLDLCFTLVQPAPEGFEAAAPLVLIHDGGGTSVSYYYLYSLDRAVYAIQNPNFYSGEKWEDGMPEMGVTYARMIRAHIPSGPILLGGEISPMMKSSSLQVMGIVMIDSVYPFVPKPPSRTIVPHKLQFGKYTKEETQRLSGNCMAEALAMVHNWTLPAWKGCTDEEMYTRRVAIEKELSEKMKAKHPDDQTEEYDTTPIGELPLLPQTVLLRCNESVPVSTPEDTTAICRVDVARDIQKLGWDQYGYDFITAVLEIPGHHFNIFSDEYVSSKSPFQSA